MKNQKGYTLLGVLLALTVSALAITVGMEVQQRQVVNDLATEAGTDLASFALGLRGFIAAAQSNPALIPPGSVVGVNWLKSPSCGGLASNPAQGYIPCSFPSYNGFSTPFGVDFSTSFTRDAATNLITARTTYIPANIELSQRGAVAAKVETTASRQDASPASGLFTSFFSNVPVTANDASGRNNVIDNTASPDFGRVLSVVSNAPSNDIYLRTDGTNQMLAALNLGGNDIVNTRDVQASGDVSALGKVNSGQGVNVLGGDVTISDGSVKATNGVNGDNRGVIVGDDVYLTDVLNGFGVPPRISQAVFDVQVKTNFETINKPSCPTGLGYPQVFASIQDISLDSGEPIHGSRVIVTDLGWGWQFYSQALTSRSGWVNSSAASKIVVMTKCL